MSETETPDTPARLSGEAAAETRGEAACPECGASSEDAVWGEWPDPAEMPWAPEEHDGRPQPTVEGYYCGHCGAIYVPERQENVERFYPHEVIKIAVIVALLAAILAFAATVLPMPVGQQADRFVTPEGIEPEWYFLPVYEFLKFVPRWVGIVVSMVVFPVLLFAVPFFWGTVTRWRWGRATLNTVVAIPVLLVTVALMISQASNAAQSDPRNGLAQYRNHCASCHGADGELVTGDVALSESAEAADPAFVADVIDEGIGTMRPVVLDEERRDAISEYVASKLAPR